MRIVLTAAGSTGDIHPMIGIGRGLRERGHDVIIVGEDGFRAASEGAGLGFVVTEAAFIFHQLAREQWWHTPERMPEIHRALTAAIRLDLDAIARACESSRTLLVSHALCLTGRLWEDLHGAPAATVHLSPWSASAAWCGEASDADETPRLADQLLAEACVAPAVNEVRSDLGLPPVSGIFTSWAHSPRCVIGLFPAWFGAPGVWPDRVRLTGFPRYDEGEQYAIDPGLEAFMAEGEPPIAFTPGSSSPCAAAFLALAVDAVTRLGRRAVLLTRMPNDVPPGLPTSVAYVPYAPFSWLLPRCAALVHHGGIGTAAQALAAGIPQMTIPFGFDQWDNTTRLRTLGVAASFDPRGGTAASLAETLRWLVNDATIAAACRRWADVTNRADAVGETCAILEALAEQTPRPMPSTC
jgi:rhamnosyltransferase subunit B